MAEILGKRNPLGRSYGCCWCGAFLVDGAIDKAFEMFTDAEKKMRKVILFGLLIQRRI